MTSDQDLIEGCKKGKHSAFEALYTRYAKRMMAIAMRYCNTTFEAEDIVQEAFIKVFEKIKTFENKGSFEGWLKRIVVNYSINHFHKTSKERAFEDSSEIELADEQAVSILSELSNNELLFTLKLLPLGYRTVFNLYVIEGYSHKEIAGLCKITESTSRSQLTKAKVLLKELLVKNSYVTHER
ncbi:MAG: polymerase, sigma-24 subunit, subfamily protein [Chitinophagaceae bacterium]|nr:polymerase, sigma-24 subunit, subfamily protein [Chitinophagaceae bacterium]